MRAEIKKEFTPVNLVLETQEEIDKTAAILNFAPICDAVSLKEEYEILKKYAVNRQKWMDQLTFNIKRV